MKAARHARNQVIATLLSLAVLVVAAVASPPAPSTMADASASQGR